MLICDTYYQNKDTTFLSLATMWTQGWSPEFGRKGQEVLLIINIQNMTGERILTILMANKT